MSAAPHATTGTDSPAGDVHGPKALPSGPHPDRRGQVDASGPPAAPGRHQAPLPLGWLIRPGVPARPAAPRHLRVVSPAERTDASADERPLPVPSADWVARIARAVSEVGTGLRPPGQLTRWVRRDTLAWLAGRGIAYQRHPSTRAAVARQGNVRPMTQVRAVRVCPVSTGAVECSAVLVGGGRARAIALRFEQDANAWIVTAITLG